MKPFTKAVARGAIVAAVALVSLVTCYLIIEPKYFPKEHISNWGFVVVLALQLIISFQWMGKCFAAFNGQVFLKVSAFCIGLLLIQAFFYLLISVNTIGS